MAIDINDLFGTAPPADAKRLADVLVAEYPWVTNSYISPTPYGTWEPGRESASFMTRLDKVLGNPTGFLRPPPSVGFQRTYGSPTNDNSWNPFK